MFVPGCLLCVSPLFLCLLSSALSVLCLLHPLRPLSSLSSVLSILCPLCPLCPPPSSVLCPLSSVLCPLSPLLSLLSFLSPLSLSILASLCHRLQQVLMDLSSSSSLCPLSSPSSLSSVPLHLPLPLSQPAAGAHGPAAAGAGLSRRVDDAGWAAHWLVDAHRQRPRRHPQTGRPTQGETLSQSQAAVRDRNRNTAVRLYIRCQFVRFSRKSYGFPLFWLAYVRTRKSLRIYKKKKKKYFFCIFKLLFFKLILL